MLPTAFSIILIVADFVSDVALAVDYCVVDTEWCIQTWIFIAGSALAGFIIVISYCCDAFEEGPHAFSYWAAAEICLESGPQLTLQLYILALSEQDTESSQDNSILTTVVRISSIVTSLLSLSNGFAAWRSFLETEVDGNWTWKDTAIDILWNVLSISPRVITLALFASFQPYWFWGFIITQILIVSSINFVFVIVKKIEPHNLMYHFFMSCFSGVGMVFNMFIAHNITIPVGAYLWYWLLMFTENTMMILLWYQWSSDLGLWYHEFAVSCLMISLLLPLIIKSLHCYVKNNLKLIDGSFFKNE